MRLLKVPVDARGYYRAYLEFLRPLIQLNRQDRDVLGELLYLQYEMKGIPENIRRNLLDQRFREQICTRLDMPAQSFYNSISRLRKANVLLGDRLNPVYVFDYDNDKQVILEFTDFQQDGEGTGGGDTPSVQ